ncbi:MAG: hypothetical protein OXC93_14260, partial [Rhodospirillaceae bacterium]|nr:hypothetical protein [Rhodospirillaceae bacterium]
NRESPGLSGLGPQPDSTAGKLHDVIVEILGNKVSRRRLSRPLPEENGHGDPVPAMEAAAGPCARTGVLP